MDQRGPLGNYEPTETDLTSLDQQSGAAAGRLQAWARIASVRSAHLEFAPSQRNYANFA
ncbi:hypothetical protein QUV83_17080 [Cellulomonas cellasea]|uniref:hypothetical protein n=1 Tax=Cellulomonas cellasea TaxID=43670 RepID=UPI0025A4C0EB|nr:hypothetical protein [Cellulomonas cellasea]MDM8086489.1 hypothetical protein [Cellulomonas cellasea]